MATDPNRNDRPTSDPGDEPRGRWGLATSWAIGLGLFTGAVAGTIVPSETGAQEVRQMAGFTLVFIPALYVVVTSRWSYWRRTNSYIRFAVYQLSFLPAAYVLVRIAGSVFGFTGALGQIVEVIAALAAFAVAVWVTFYGGADRAWVELIDRTGIEW
ncbi:hypothetical protein [Halorubrum salsamenti]|jgi:hypothetical protein|uniref:hypothetical protein n=1 Tax=Halorubrum salsamenti TaxID=2583990 RepID=UPI0011A2A031|nr:hypothetical protein [Halorubrum salsamenti]